MIPILRIKQMPRGISYGRNVSIGKRVTVAGLAKKVRKNTRILNQREIGRVSQDLTASPTTTASIQLVSSTATGDDISSRDGRKIHAESIEISGNVSKAAAAPFSLYRILLVRDNLGTTTAPVITDIFQDEDAFFQGEPRLHNPQPLKRFTVLWDKFIVLNEGFDGQREVKSFKMKKKLNFDIFYSGTTATDEGKNSLWLIQASDEATNVPVVNAGFIMMYSDL